MAYFSTNAICFKKKKKVHIWAWIKLIINTFNVTLGLCWSACPSQPARCGRTRAAQLSLQLFLQPNTICSALRGNVAPSCGGLLPPCPPAATLGWNFLPVKPLWLPKLPAGIHRVPPLTLEVTLEREAPVPPPPFQTERGVLRQGGAGDSVPKPHHELICCDLRAKDLGTRHSYFRGRWGNSIIYLPRFGKSEGDGSRAPHLQSHSSSLPLPSLPASPFRLWLDGVSWRAPSL